MVTTSDVKVTPGTGANVATYDITEDSETKKLQRIVLSTALGVDLDTFGSFGITPTANFTRPADTTAYASGDLVANSTTAGSVAALSWTVARANAGSGAVRKARIKKSTTGVTNTAFRLHLYSADPTLSSGITNGDNSAWLTKIAGYMGSCDVSVDKAFSDGAAGQGAPNSGAEINFVCGGGSQLIYGLIEARAAYTPGNAEVFTVELEVLQN